MGLALVLHPDSHCTSVSRVDVDVARSRSGVLLLSYRITGNIGELRIPPMVVSTRGDELWRHTCFEAFVRAPSSATYCELNLAPSAQWAAYRFSDYRDGMSIESEIDAPRIDVQANAACWQLHASLDLGRLPYLPNDATWQLGLSAVLEETSGRKSHWALAHPLGKADFHHADCFAHALPAVL